MGHVSLSQVSEPEKFFDFSFSELATYDLPAQVNMVLQKTGRANLTYIGHSAGTTQMFYALARNEPSLKSKINLFVALAPVAEFGHQDGSLNAFSGLADLVGGIFAEEKIYTFFGPNDNTNALFKAAELIMEELEDNKENKINDASYS